MRINKLITELMELLSVDELNIGQHLIKINVCNGVIKRLTVKEID